MNLLIALCAFLTIADDVKFPDTPAGRSAAAYIKSYNSGREDAIREFEAEYRAEGGAQGRTIDQRIAIFQEIRRTHGDLTPFLLGDQTDHELALVVKAATSGETLQLRFMCDTAAPHKLRGIAIQPVDASAASAPRLTSDQRRAALDELLAILDEQYVFPEKAATMAQRLRSALAAGDYDALDTPAALAQRWSADLLAVCGDKHLRVRVADPQAAPRLGPRNDDAAGNFGFKRVEVLPGNIGYIKLNGFSGQRSAEAPAAAAMAFVQNCDQLIFDLRENGGGSPQMISFLQTYLFDEKTHLNSFRDRAGELVDENWTRDEIPGQRLGSKVPVFVLTSNYTFSGAEEFAFNLQSRGRATIVGETSGGGAHPVRPARFGTNFLVTVPYMRAENPVTKSNWEGVGVVPEVKVPAEKALDMAVELASKGSDAPVKSAPTNASESDRAAIERAVLDYCEAFYENKPEYLERSVDRDLKKFGYALQQGGAWKLYTLSFDQAVSLAQRYKPRNASPPKTVRILDVQERIACATLTAEWGIDYFQLHKVDDRWKIVHVVWQSIRP